MLWLWGNRYWWIPFNDLTTYGSHSIKNYSKKVCVLLAGFGIPIQESSYTFHPNPLRTSMTFWTSYVDLDVRGFLPRSLQLLHDGKHEILMKQIFIYLFVGKSILVFIKYDVNFNCISNFFFELIILLVFHIWVVPRIESTIDTKEKIKCTIDSEKLLEYN